MNAYEQIGNDETIMTNLYRYAVIARIFGISPDENMDIKVLSEKSRREMRVDDFNEGINRLAMLFGAGFIDEDTFCFMEKNCIDYRSDLKAAEDLIVSQNDAAPEDKTTPALIQNALRCAAYSKKYKEMQAVSFNEALQMTERTHIYIKDGVMRARDKEFLAFLADIDEPMGHLQDNGVYVENKSNIEQMALDDNTVCDDFPVIFRMRNANIYSALFDKIYGKEFIRYAKENKITLDDKNCDMKYRKYIERVKLHFDIRHYERKRQICGDTVNWFDYAPSIDGTITDNLKGLTEMKSIDLEETQHYDEDTLIEKATAKYRNTYAFGAEAVIEVYHNSKEMLFTIDGVRDRAFVESMRAEFNIPARHNEQPAQYYAPQERKPAYFGRETAPQEKGNVPTYYNRDGYKDIQNKEYIRTDARTAYTISKEAQKFGIEHSVKYDGEKSVVTLDGVKNRDFIAAVRKEFNIPETSRPERQPEKPAYFGHRETPQESRAPYPARDNNSQRKEATYYNREGFKDIQNKTYIRTDSRTAYAISKEAQKYGIEHSVKYDGEKSAVTMDGVKDRDFIETVKRMAEWAEKVQVMEAQNKNRSRYNGAR
ncbi:MAG: hypothetical protein ACI4JF_10775 [Oscillospiraceae bacterium]